MNCPKCGGECHPITETFSKGKDVDGGKACCGTICFGKLGLLCGACGKGKQTYSNTYWLCNQCSNKFKA